jgi:hypothetical protein
VNNTSIGARARFLDQVRTGRRVVVVAPGGDDTGPGTDSMPYATINHAVSTAQPGDLIEVEAGVYGYTHIRDYQGDPENWLVVMPRSPAGAVQVTMAPPSDNVFNITGSSYVGVFGLEVHGHQENPNTNGSGISVYGGSHHVMVWGCDVHDFPGGGINCFDVDGSHDLVDISFNVIHSTSKYSPHNTSGISIHGSRDLTDDTWDGQYAYRIVGNYIYDVECSVPYTVGGYDFVTDGNAISVDDLLTRHAYDKPVLIADNVLVGCGGRAVHVHASVNTDVVSNLGIDNMRTRSPAIDGYPQFDGDTNASNLFARNVLCSREKVDRPDVVSTWVDNLENFGQDALSYFVGDLTWDRLQGGLPITAFQRRHSRRQ